MRKTLLLLLAATVAVACSKSDQPANQTAAPSTTTATPVPPPSTPVAMASSETLAPPQVPGTAWILLDHASGNVLAGHNIDTPVHPASITKVMTSYIVADRIARGDISVDDDVFISENAWRSGGAGTDGSFTALKVNDRVKLGEVVHGLVIQSGNDASIALAEHIAGSEAAFADLMNQYAQRLGMTNSHFVNAHGLTAEGHMMSVHDIARLSSALIRDYPEHYALYSIKEYSYGGITQYNRNGLLWRDNTVDGIKTGHTSAAGYCLAVSSKRGDQRLISVVMGIEGTRSEGFRQREEANQALLNYGFRAFETHRLYTAGQVVAEPELWRSSDTVAKLAVGRDLYATIPRGRYNDLQAETVLPQLLIGPLTEGQELGSVTVSIDGAQVAQVPLVSAQAHEEAGFFRRVWHDILLLFE